MSLYSAGFPFTATFLVSDPALYFCISITKSSPLTSTKFCKLSYLVEFEQNKNNFNDHPPQTKLIQSELKINCKNLSYSSCLRAICLMWRYILNSNFLCNIFLIYTLCKNYSKIGLGFRSQLKCQLPDCQHSLNN